MAALLEEFVDSTLAARAPSLGRCYYHYSEKLR